MASVKEILKDAGKSGTAAHFKARHRLSYADAFVAVLAVRELASVLTGDPEFGNLKELVTVEWLTAH